jgi:hypothetical protein
MIKKTSLFILLALTVNVSANTKSDKIRKEVICLFSYHTEISVKDRIKLIAQSALESGHYKKHIYKNNVFGIKKRHSNKYANFKSIEECVNERIRIFNHKKCRFTKDYAPHNKNYNKLLEKVIVYVKKHYNLKEIT